MSKIHLFVSVDIKADKFEEFVSKLTDHVAKIRKEHGCEAIDIFAEGENKNQVHLWEVWSDRAAWDVHMNNADSAAWQEVARELVNGETIKVLRSI